MSFKLLALFLLFGCGVKGPPRHHPEDSIPAWESSYMKKNQKVKKEKK